jgi:RNA polymerase sigma factor (TIGR02999 family)
MMSPPENITALLAEAGRGDEEARHALWKSVYEDLRRIAHRALYRRQPGQTLQTTALVNESYLKLVDQAQAGWEDRLHFFAVAARAMRHILIDYARQRHRQKRGGGRPHVALDEVLVAADERAETFLALDKALTHLATLNERWAQVVEYRFFGGMTEEEIAGLFGVSERTVRRDWRKAKAWLATALAESEAPARSTYRAEK